MRTNVPRCVLAGTLTIAIGRGLDKDTLYRLQITIDRQMFQWSSAVC